MNYFAVSLIIELYVYQFMALHRRLCKCQFKKQKKGFLLLFFLENTNCSKNLGLCKDVLS